jgi:CRISPR-associated protein Cas5d
MSGVKSEMTVAIRIYIAGEFACFTRPEAKVERVSYPLPTPSAARNILDAICWRPEMRWLITSISLIKPVRYVSIRRNELQSKVVPSIIKKWMSGPEYYEPLVAGAAQNTDSTLRNTLALANVGFVIEARPLVFNTNGDNTPQKYAAMLMRRAEKGQCYSRPYLGCREFPADFRPGCPEDTPMDVTEELGRMLYDITFRPEGNQAVFFDARLQNGVMDTRPEAVLGREALRAEVLACSYRR